MTIFIKIVLSGIGATLLMDIWSLVLSFFSVKTLNYRFVGRWIGHFSKGKFNHANIAESSPVRHEAAMGWAMHYIIGITFSFLLVICFGTEWLYNPTLLPALIIGIVTIVAPFFIMQPAFGFGVAASKMSRPWLSRFMSLVSHSIYGLGLYVSALVMQALAG